MKILLSVIVSLLLLIYPASNANALQSLSTIADTDTPTVQAGCEKEPIDINADYAQHPFENPDSITSQSGLLETTIRVNYGDNQIADCGVHLRSYNGKLVGPTLRVQPGDTIKIHLINELPPEEDSDEIGEINQGSVEGCTYEEKTQANNTPHNFNTTNFHTHGLHVDPNACSDNVLRVMRPRENDRDISPEYLVQVEIPGDHPAGTFWYHAHLHGSTALQVSSGMAGALIIEGGLDDIPEIPTATEKIFVFQQIGYDEGGVIEDYGDFGVTNGVSNWRLSNRQTTINGQIIPVITMHPGEVQRWRFIHAGVRETINLELRGNNRQIPLHEIAVDGIPLGKRDSWRRAPIELEPGYRSDALFRAPLLLRGKTSQEYDLIDAASTGKKSLRGTPEAGSILAKVIVTGESRWMRLPTNDQIAQVKQQQAPEDITDEEVPTVTQEVIFSVNAGATTTYTVNGQSFDPANSRVLQLGNAEKWHLSTDVNSVAPSHPFHIHVNPFQVERTGPNGDTETIWRDTLLVTQDSPQDIRTRYSVFTGRFVLHCHILDHEDHGMMQVVEIQY